MAACEALFDDILSPLKHAVDFIIKNWEWYQKKASHKPPLLTSLLKT